MVNSGENFLEKSRERVIAMNGRQVRQELRPTVLIDTVLKECNVSSDPKMNNT